MSAEALNDAAIAQAYDVVPAIAAKPGIIPALHEIDGAMKQLPQVFKSIGPEAIASLEHALSSHQVKAALAEKYKTDLAAIEQPDARIKSKGGLLRKGYLFLKKKMYSAATSAKRLFNKHVVGLCKDAYSLFGENVGSIAKDTAKALLTGSALSKVGAVLSFPGKIFEGMSIFWEKLVQKHPALKPLDTFVVTPVAALLYVKMWPAIVAAKACEFVGRSMEEVDKTGQWSSIATVGMDMLSASAKHAMRIIAPTGAIVKQLLTHTPKVVKMIDGSEEKTKINGVIEFGVKRALNDPVMSKEKLQMEMSHLKESEIDINSLLTKVQELHKIFAGKVLQPNKSFEEIIDTISKSKLEQKYSLIADVTTEMVKSRKQVKAPVQSTISTTDKPQGGWVSKLFGGSRDASTGPSRATN